MTREESEVSNSSLVNANDERLNNQRHLLLVFELSFPVACESDDRLKNFLSSKKEERSLNCCSFHVQMSGCAITNTKVKKYELHRQNLESKILGFV